MGLSYKCESCGTISIVNLGICFVCDTFGSIRQYKKEFEDFTEDKHDGVYYDRSNPKYHKRCN